MPTANAKLQKKAEKDGRRRRKSIPFNVLQSSLT